MRPYRFDHVWHNALPHVLVPIALDGSDETALADKAIRWAGQVTDLQGADEPFRLHLILGEPSSKTLSSEYYKAIAFLMDRADPRVTEVIPQEKIPEFTDRTIAEIKVHVDEAE